MKYAHAPGGPDAILDIDLQPGGDNALHRHRTFDKHFECQAGELRMQVGRHVHTLLPGQTATAPATAFSAPAPRPPASPKINIGPGNHTRRGSIFCSDLLLHALLAHSFFYFSDGTSD